jgi:hypothetical protein
MKHGQINAYGGFLALTPNALINKDKRELHCLLETSKMLATENTEVTELTSLTLLTLLNSLTYFQIFSPLSLIVVGKGLRSLMDRARSLMVGTRSMMDRARSMMVIEYVHDGDRIYP